MAAVLSNISNIIIPVIIFYIVAYGISSRCNVYEDFIRGAKEGFHTVIQIMPTLIGLMVAVGILRASGFWNLSGNCSAVWRRDLDFPGACAVDVCKDVFLLGGDGTGA